MLSFFRLNDPYRIVVLIVLLALFRLSAFMGSLPLTLPELSWMVAGERLSTGAIMYRDLLDNLAPFAAFTYAGLDWLFGRSQLAYQLIAFFLVIVQATIFNVILLRNKAYNENTYVPALMYALLMNMFFDFLTLSPALIGLTFVMLSLNKLLYQVESRSNDENILLTGLFLSVATLFYLPSFLFVFSTLLVYLFFTGTRARQYMLFFYGFLIPIVLVSIYYYWHGALYEFYLSFVYASFALKSYNYLNFGTLGLVLIVPGIFILLSFYKIFDALRYNNQQVRIQQTMLFFLVMGLFSWIFIHRRAPYHLMVLVIPMAFYLTHYFLLIRRRYLAEIMLTLFIGYMVFAVYGSAKNWYNITDYLQYDDLLVQEHPLKEQVNDKRLWVIGDEISLYENATLATPYYNYAISKLQLEELGYYDNLTAIYRALQKDYPEIIVDENEIFPAFQKYIPILKTRYKEIEPGVYVYQE